MPNIFSKIFSRKKVPQKTESAEILSSGTAIFTPFSGDAYESDIYRAAVDAIARNAAKLKGTHVITSPDKRKVGDNSINYILQVRPNPYMTAYDAIYKLVTHYYLYNNAFAFLQKDDKGNLAAVYPLAPQSVEYVTDQTGNLYCHFLFANGQEVTLSFSEVFVIRRFFNSNDLLGDTNTAILPALDLAHTQNDGLENAIKSNATIRGILKYNQVMSPEKLKEEKDAFINDYLNISNNGGVAVIDSKADYTPLESKPIAIDDKQLEAVKKKIYEYLGISEKIVNSSYSEDDWAAFYESTIEPLAVQFSLELTEKVFTQREQAFGNSIIFEANRLQFASTKTKNDLIFKLLPMGLISINEAREILNMPSLIDGNKFIQSLNYVNKNIADQYQLNSNGGSQNEGA